MNTSPRTDRPFLPSDLAPDRALIRAAFSFAAQASKGGGDPLAKCRELFPNDPGALAVVTKADQVVGTAAGTGWAAELVQQATMAFLSSLGPQSAASQLISRGVSISLAGVGSAVVPARSGSPSTVPFVADGSPIPLRVQTIAPTTLSPKKLGVITAMSNSLARRSTALPIFEMLLKEDAAVGLDSAYFSANVGTSAAHQGLLYGLSAITPFGSMSQDLAALASAVGAAGSGQVIFVTGPGRAATVPILSPNLTATVLGSLAVPEDRVIAIDPLSIVHGFGSEPEFLISNEAVTHMSDAPLEIVSGTGPTTADPVRSMWQTDSVALRLLLDIGFGARRSGAVAFMDGVLDWWV
jgi:hypothetical protein